MGLPGTGLWGGQGVWRSHGCDRALVRAGTPEGFAEEWGRSRGPPSGGPGWVSSQRGPEPSHWPPSPLGTTVPRWLLAWLTRGLISVLEAEARGQRPHPLLRLFLERMRLPPVSPRVSSGRSVSGPLLVRTPFWATCPWRPQHTHSAVLGRVSTWESSPEHLPHGHCGPLPGLQGQVQWPLPDPASSTASTPGTVGTGPLAWADCTPPSPCAPHPEGLLQKPVEQGPALAAGLMGSPGTAWQGSAATQPSPARVPTPGT